MSQSFEQWLDEVENYATRRERARDDLGPRYEEWLWAAWVGGMDCADPLPTDSKKEHSDG